MSPKRRKTSEETSKDTQGSTAEGPAERDEVDSAVSPQRDPPLTQDLGKMDKESTLAGEGLTVGNPIDIDKLEANAPAEGNSSADGPTDADKPEVSSLPTAGPSTSHSTQPEQVISPSKLDSPNSLPVDSNKDDSAHEEDSTIMQSVETDEPNENNEGSKEPFPPFSDPYKSVPKTSNEGASKPLSSPIIEPPPAESEEKDDEQDFNGNNERLSRFGHREDNKLLSIMQRRGTLLRERSLSLTPAPEERENPDALGARIAKMKLTIRDKEKTVKELEKEVRRLHQENKDLQSQVTNPIARKDTDKNTTKLHVARLEKQRDALYEDMDQQADIIKDRDLKLADKEVEIQRLESRETTREKGIKEIVEARDRAEMDRDRFKQETNHKERKVKTLQNTISDQDSSLAKLYKRLLPDQELKGSATFEQKMDQLMKSAAQLQEGASQSRAHRTTTDVGEGEDGQAKESLAEETQQTNLQFQRQELEAEISAKYKADYENRLATAMEEKDNAFQKAADRSKTSISKLEERLKDYDDLRARIDEGNNLLSDELAESGADDDHIELYEGFRLLAIGLLHSFEKLLKDVLDSEKRAELEARTREVEERSEEVKFMIEELESDKNTYLRRIKDWQQSSRDYSSQRDDLKKENERLTAEIQQNVENCMHYRTSERQFEMLEHFSNDLLTMLAEAVISVEQPGADEQETSGKGKGKAVGSATEETPGLDAKEILDQLQESSNNNAKQKNKIARQDAKIKDLMKQLAYYQDPVDQATSEILIDSGYLTQSWGLGRQSKERERATPKETNTTAATAGPGTAGIPPFDHFATPESIATPDLAHDSLGGASNASVKSSNKGASATSRTSLSGSGASRGSNPGNPGPSTSSIQIPEGVELDIRQNRVILGTIKCPGPFYLTPASGHTTGLTGTSTSAVNNNHSLEVNRYDGRGRPARSVDPRFDSEPKPSPFFPVWMLDMVTNVYNTDVRLTTKESSQSLLTPWIIAFIAVFLSTISYMLHLASIERNLWLQANSNTAQMYHTMAAGRGLWDRVMDAFGWTVESYVGQHHFNY